MENSAPPWPGTRSGTFGTLLNAAEMDELIRQNLVKRTRLPRHIHSEEPPLVSLDDLKSLLKQLPEPSRSIAALIVLTELRIGEMLALRWCDVDLIAGTLRVRQSVYEGHFDTPKTKRSRGVVPLISNCGSDPRVAEAGKRDCSHLLFRDEDPALSSQSAQSTVPTDCCKAGAEGS